MKNIFQSAFIVLCSFGLLTNVVAQKKYGNEWLVPGNTYLKLKVSEDGVYKVTFEEMMAAGFIQGKIAGKDLRLINYGQEQAIHVSNNDFNTGGYIEFYGKKNRIGMDSLLYKNWQKDLFNPEYSLVSDTNVYFLTLEPNQLNKRYVSITPDYSNVHIDPTPYYIHEEKIVYSNVHYKNVDLEVRSSYFEPSEGFGTTIVGSSNHPFNVSKIYANGPKPIIQCRIGSNNQVSKLEMSFNNQLLDTRNNGARATMQLTYEIDNDLLKNGTNNFGIKNIASATDRHRVAYASLTYARQFDFLNNSTFFFNMPTNPGKRFLKIDNFKSDNQITEVFDFEHDIKYTTAIVNNQVLVLLYPAEQNTRYFITTESAKKHAATISLFTPLSFEDEGTQFLIITNSFFRNNGSDYVQAYADYRSSKVGGSYKTKIVDIQSIYDHFGYGIDRHFYSIKQMSKFLHENWKALDYVFILGKGLEYNIIRTSNDIKNRLHKTFFVPTYGFLGSDNMLFSEDNYPDPYFAIGRLAVKTPEDIKNYLDKLQQYEAVNDISQTIEDKYWLKRVLQLGGGITTGEQSLIQNGLNRMTTIIQDTIFGGEVHNYFKESSDPILYETNEQINQFFNRGVSLVNFFGHSSAGSWEFPIDNPKNFTNFGRYPFLNALGCYAGNLHSDGVGLSEAFVLEKGRGSIAFLASTGSAYIPSLSTYGQNFMHNLFSKSRSLSYGAIARNLAYDKRNATGTDQILYSQITYHGDPAIHFHVFDAPDYTFDAKSVKTVPTIVQGDLKNYEVQVDLVNLGIYTGDTVDIVCYHQLPDGSIIDTIIVKADQIANRRTISIPLKNYNTKSLGKNNIFVTIDPANKYKELPLPAAKSNNSLNDGRGFEYYVIGNFANVVYPPDFAMINTKEHFVLKASTNTVPFVATNYIFQIDTTAYFNSPILESGIVKSSGGTIEYQPKIDLVADRVYFWRISPDSTSNEGYRWSQASFAYLPKESEGWNQSHFFQFAANMFNNLEISEMSHRQFEFGKLFNTVQLKNRLWDPVDRPGYTFNNVRYGSITPWDYMDSGLGFVIGDRNNFVDGIFNPIGGKYGSINPVGKAIKGFFFKTDTKADREKIINFIESELKPNYYLHVFSILKNGKSAYHFDGWEQDSLTNGKNIFNVLEALGAKQIRNLLKDTVPYIFQVENGRQVLAELIGTSKTDIIQSKITVSKYLPSGNVTSVPIGKANKWGDLKLDIPLDDLQKSSLTTFSIKDNIATKRDSASISGFYTQPVDASDYLQLKLTNRNDSTKIAPQLSYWRIGYEPIPDAAIQFVKNIPDPNVHTLVQGEQIQIQYRVVNVNFVDMDSIRVRYTYTDSENKSLSRYKMLPPLKSGKVIDDFVNFEIGSGRTTDIKLTIEINPDGQQPELYHFNNTLTQQFSIKGDNDNPILQVAFDGIQIMDGDIVSSSPEIGVTLFDENKFLPITDPQSFEIKIDTGHNEFFTVDVNQPNVRFEPATTESKTAKLYFKPTFKDGEYKMLVQGKDVSGNKSGIHPRSVTFNVITAKTVSNFLNYPNPFSNSTQFIFTLTGDEVPENISISIYTVTGKVVREIRREELGALHIGVNRTTYRWDGTDEYGEKLANGVYLYKVNVLHKDGKKYDNFSNKSIDKYFKEGFGKLVIMR